MKETYTDISVVLDRSGSMESIREDIIGGFNTFLADQQNQPGACTLSLVQFDNQYEVVHAAIPIAQAPALTGQTYVPRGSTALLDAVGRTINETRRRIGEAPEASRPERVVFVIITDGYENASREFTRPQIMEMIEERKEKDGWEFVFLAANQDAIREGGGMGIGAGHAMTFHHSGEGSRAAFAAVSKKMAMLRIMEAADMSFEEEDREKQEEISRRDKKA